MRITHLLKAMERIAGSLLVDKHNPDYRQDNVEFVHQTGATTPFMWMLTEEHTFLFQADSKSRWISDLIKAMDYADKHGQDYCLYFYDCRELAPIFPRTIRAQAK